MHVDPSIEASQQERVLPRTACGVLHGESCLPLNALTAASISDGGGRRKGLMMVE